MNVWHKAVLSWFALMFAVARVAPAQGRCDINLDGPRQVKNALKNLTLAQVGGKPEDSKKRVRSAVEALTENPEKSDNPVGRQYLLGQALIWWASQPGTPERVRRGELGFKTNPGAVIDVLAAADSNFTAVERAKPACAEETRQHRWPLYGKLVDQATALIDANKLDQAGALLKRARMVYRESPYAYYYEAILAQRRNDNAAALAGFRRALELATPEIAAKDSGVAAVREQSMFHVGLTAFNQATALQGAEQAGLMREAAASFQAYLKAYPTGANVPAAQTGLSRAITQAGDTAAAAALYKGMLAEPAKYSEEQLFEAGGNAFQTGNKEEAAQLFSHGLEKNPYYRPALFNLANTYFALERWEDMLPVARKLVEVDPNNPDNWQLLAIAHEGLSKKAASPKERRVHMDSVRTSLTTSNNLPVRVSFSQFERSGSTHTLAGTIENVSGKNKDYTLKFEFLDRQGNVVTTQETQVSVPAKGKKDFRVQVTQDGVAAFRYARVS